MTAKGLVIDGAAGEGGGQVLRSALSLSSVTGKPFRIHSIRGGRKKPGLLRQHLTAVRASAEITGARVKGATLGSTELSFEPQAIRAGSYTFAVGTAGSATLVLQTVLPVLLAADGPSQVCVQGGTHNPSAPPFDFLQRSFLPQLERMGARVTAELERPGFFPAGGGSFRVSVQPTGRLGRLDLTERGESVRISARALVAHLSESIGERELQQLSKNLEIAPENTAVESVADSQGPGNVLFVEVESASHTEVFTAFGMRGVSGRNVATSVAKQARAYLAARVPVGEYLADQLLLPMALHSGGVIRTQTPSRHTRTNADVIERFLDVEVEFEEESRQNWLVKVAEVNR